MTDIRARAVTAYLLQDMELEQGSFHVREDTSEFVLKIEAKSAQTLGTIQSVFDSCHETTSIGLVLYVWLQHRDVFMRAFISSYLRKQEQERLSQAQ